MVVAKATARVRSGASARGQRQRRRLSVAPRLMLVVAAVAGMLLAASASSALGEPAWPTYHRDAARSGADPDGVNPVTPNLAWQSAGLGAPIWGQPLVLGSRVYVATVGDDIYALDAGTGKVAWTKNAGTPVPSGELACGDVTPTVGVVSTPVIDTAKKTLYVLADTWNASTKEAHHVLEGYSLANGADVLSTQVDPPGSGPKTLLQRAALNLDKGSVLVGFGGNDGDCGTYRGALASVPESGGAPTYWQYSPASPAYGGGALWGTSGPAVDAKGTIFASDGNPNFPSGSKVATYDYSDSLLEFSPSLTREGYFEPPSWVSDSNSDVDLGSAGPELLPGGLAFQAGKNQTGYLIDEATMASGAGAVYSQKVCEGRSFGGDAFANGTIFIPCTDGVRALAYNQSTRTFATKWHGPSDAVGPPIVSSGSVWVVSGSALTGGGTKLYALDPATGSVRYTETLPAPVIDHFASPSAAGGRVFVATGTSVTAYQVAQPTPAISGVTPKRGPVAGGTTVAITGNGFTGATAVRFGATAAPSFTVNSDTSVTAVSPAHTAGIYDISVTTAVGTSAASAKDHFTYTPTITKVTPATGSTSGGNSVSVAGTGFAVGTTATTFKFGTAPATGVNCSSSTACTMVAPPHAAAAVYVKATVNRATSPASATARYTYG
jgi:outer membrane protein assembly factor BamB